jgi:hypothetical protein
MPTGLGQKDTLLFYFSGHGALFKNDGVTYSTDDEQVINSSFYGQALIYPEEASSFYEDDVIFPSQLFARLQATGAGTIIVILDICNSGGFVLDRGHEVDGLPENYTDDWPAAFSLSWERYFRQNGEDNPYPNIHVISAAGKNEESMDEQSSVLFSELLDNGVYSYYLLESLGYNHSLNTPTVSISADMNHDGIVTLSELYNQTFNRFQSEYLRVIDGDPEVSSESWSYYPHITGGSGDPILFYLD